ncbi:glycosyltransferase [Polaribacter sp.]|uniref:glycosyltransferase n=1 Tax=Polaribacter sp. TaxID=1920175 RepID=UPI003F4CA3C2
MLNNKFIKPKISIIIPVFNNLKGLQKSIESIRNQIFINFEVWVIDGDSSTETQDYLRSLKTPFFYQSEKDSGIYDAMNKGVFLSKGDWLYFLGTGDVFYNESVLEQVFVNSLNENTNLIAGKIIYEGETKPFIYSEDKMLKNISWSSFMWIRNGLHHQGTFYKKTLFTHRKYSLKYKILSDYWLNLHLFKSKETCSLLDLIISECNSDGVSKTGHWSIYQEEVQLKTDLSSPFFRPFFYIIAVLKFLSRKMVNGS